MECVVYAKMCTVNGTGGLTRALLRVSCPRFVRRASYTKPRRPSQRVDAEGEPSASRRSRCLPGQPHACGQRPCCAPAWHALCAAARSVTSSDCWSPRSQACFWETLLKAKSSFTTPESAMLRLALLPRSLALISGTYLRAPSGRFESPDSRIFTIF